MFGEPVEEGDGRVGALTHRVELLDGGGAAVVSLPQSADQLPDRVAVQHLPLFRVRLSGHGLIDQTLDADHVFIASRQGADTDEDLPEVGERLTVGKFVERLVGQVAATGSEVGEDRRDGLLPQPSHGGDGVFGTGEVVPQCLQSGMKRHRRRAEDLVEALVDQAANALAGMRIGRVAAGRAVVPDGARGAVLTARFGGGARDDGSGLPARTASGRAALARGTPRLADDSRCAARLFLAADRARRDRQRRAGAADRPVRRSDADRASAAAVETDFEVVRVGDQAVRTQRSAVLVASGWFAPGAATCAFLDAGMGDTGAADALPVKRFVDADDAMAAGQAGRTIPETPAA